MALPPSLSVKADGKTVCSIPNHHEMGNIPQNFHIGPVAEKIFDKERAKKLPEYTIFRESCVFRYVLDFFSKLVLAQVAQ